MDFRAYTRRYVGERHCVRDCVINTKDRKWSTSFAEVSFSLETMMLSNATWPINLMSISLGPVINNPVSEHMNPAHTLRIQEYTYLKCFLTSYRVVEQVRLPIDILSVSSRELCSAVLFVVSNVLLCIANQRSDTIPITLTTWFKNVFNYYLATIKMQKLSNWSNF